MTKLDNCNDPAFPVARADGYVADGLTKWEWFAGQAIAGLSTQMGLVYTIQSPTCVAKYAAEIADAMIAEGSKGDE